YEYKFINCISKEILKKICGGPLHVGENLVGIDFHFEKLDLSRFVKLDKVHMIGICGISGIGKTTLVKAIYNLMYAHFDGSCFCEDVKEVTKRQGLIQVQLHMIGKLMKTEDLKILSVGEGSMVLKKTMSSKSILLVLDDVDDHEQFEALAGSPDWFFPGSLIIFTGKDKQLLRSHKVDGIYEMESLDDYKALELFSLYAFGKRHPTQDFEESASQIKSELDRLQTHPNSEILQKLRPSFDSLASDQKRMFLDIACVFIGENKDFAASVLDNSHCSANAIIEVLANKIHAKSQKIVDFTEEYDVLNVNKVTEEVEVLVLLLKKTCQNIPIDGQALTRMKSLRILKICFSNFEGCWQPFALNFSGRVNLLSNKLRLLYWDGCPFKYIPSNFYPENIVDIDLSYSNIIQLWTTPKCLRRLKIVKLRYCCNLTTTPDFSEITNLEELDLEGCVNLVTIHPSIGMLKRLVVLNMRDCRRARSFPSKVEMDSLQVLNLSGCLKVDKLPEDLGKIKSLTELHVDKTAITELPSYASSLINLKSLSFGGQRRMQPRCYCNLVQVPDGLGGLSCLRELNLQGNNLLEKLEVLPELPPNVWNVYASDCTSLREVLGSSKDSYKRRFNFFRNCPNLFKNVTVDNEGCIWKTQSLDSSITSQGFIHQLSGCLGYYGLQTNRCEYFLQDGGYVGLELVYHGNSMREWFTNRSTESHVKVELPSHWCYDKFCGFGTCLVFKCKNPFSTFKGFSVKNFDGVSIAKNYIPYEIKVFLFLIGTHDSYMIWLHYTRYTRRRWEEAKNFVTFSFFEENNEDVEVKEFGVRLICEGDIEQGAESSMLQGLPTPTQHGGMLGLNHTFWSW
ncbi:NB-ARC domains-containing protein, partial [Tanacetum coccineum]